MRAVLLALVGRTIPTLTGQPNRVLAVSAEDVMVATRRSPEGKPVPIADIQSAADRLFEAGEIEISVANVGYRSAFVGAVLSSLPGAEPFTNPRRICLEPSAR